MSAGKLRVVIVDDEEPARQVLREYLAEHDSVQIVAECPNGFEAVKAIPEADPDLVLLDIQMPKLDGFEVLELLDEPPPVVFVTAYDEYALRAFEVHAADYLLKPVDPERLAEALERVRETRRPPPDARKLAAEARPEDAPLERVLVKDRGDISVIPVEKIDYLEAQDDYVNIVAGGKNHLKQQTLASFEKALPPGLFVRVHRSYILNISRLSRLELYAKDSRLAILGDGSQIPVSRSGYARLKRLL